MSLARSSPARHRSASTISGSEARTDTGIVAVVPRLGISKTLLPGRRKPGRRNRSAEDWIQCLRGLPARPIQPGGHRMIPLLLILLLLALAFGGFFVFTLKVAVVVALILLVIGLFSGWSMRGRRPPLGPAPSRRPARRFRRAVMGRTRRAPLLRGPALRWTGA